MTDSNLQKAAEALGWLIESNRDKFQQAVRKPTLRGWFVGQLLSRMNFEVVQAEAQTLVDTVFATAVIVAPSAESSEQSILATIRGMGYAVAVHNDYVQNDQDHTFWLFTHPFNGSFVKGEGRTDAEALAIVLRQIRPQMPVSTLPDRTETDNGDQFSTFRFTPGNKASRDQIAAVMLQHGTPEQKAEALEYASIRRQNKYTLEPIAQRVYANIDGRSQYLYGDEVVEPLVNSGVRHRGPVQDLVLREDAQSKIDLLQSVNMKLIEDYNAKMIKHAQVLGTISQQAKELTESVAALKTSKELLENKLDRLRNGLPEEDDDFDNYISYRD